MPAIDIYFANMKIDTRGFQRDFMIVAEQNGNKLRWEADEETASKKGGAIMVWIRAALHPPEIHFVPPGWELFIDGVVVVEKDSKASARFDIEVHGKVAEIRHDDFRFVCQF
jgi:hypothetical protein